MGAFLVSMQAGRALSLAIKHVLSQAPFQLFKTPLMPFILYSKSQPPFNLSPRATSTSHLSYRTLAIPSDKRGWTTTRLGDGVGPGRGSLVKKVDSEKEDPNR